MPELNRNQTLAVGTASVVVSEQKDNNNSERSSIILINTSTAGQVITLSIDQEAVAGAGIVLSVGGVWQDSKDGGYKPTQKQIYAISSGAAGQLSIQERLGGQ